MAGPAVVVCEVSEGWEHWAIEIQLILRRDMFEGVAFLGVWYERESCLSTRIIS
jgi:hypothetical protein